MRRTVNYALCMKTIQIRNVPDDAHRRLKARAAMQGRSLSDLVLREMLSSLEQPTFEEWRELVEADEPFEIPGGSVAVIHAGRDERDRELELRRRDGR